MNPLEMKILCIINMNKLSPPDVKPGEANTYSMDYRNGPNSYDCSSAVYYALMAGAISAGWAVNTEYEHDWLIKNGFKLIAENTD